MNCILLVVSLKHDTHFTTPRRVEGFVNLSGCYIPRWFTHLQMVIRSSTNWALKQLHWLPIQARVQFKLCTLMHGIHNSQCPAHLSNAVQLVATTSTREGLRSAATTNYATPRLWTKFGERAFSHAGPAAWNRLPEAVRQAQTQLHFKKLLKIFLFNEFLWLRFITDVVMSAVLSFVSGH